MNNNVTSILLKMFKNANIISANIKKYLVLTSDLINTLTSFLWTTFIHFFIIFTVKKSNQGEEVKW